MAAAKKKQDDKNLAILRELITHNGNKNCFDCSQRGPTYVNMTIGSFVCSKCSGMLRGLTPPHRVKSISMATFTPEEIGQIKSQGNDYCKTIWLALYEGNFPLKDEQSIKDYMSDKYEKKRYYMEPNSIIKQATIADKPPVLQNTSPKDNGIWNSSTLKQSAFKPSTAVTKLPPTFSISKPSSVSTNVEPSNIQTPPACPRFPVDFATADIFNSSQMNNNLIMPATQSQISFANFDKKNANTETQDRYAALADLDFALRQQHQTQSQDENKSSNINPFEMNSISQLSKNPFYSNALAVNGNNLNYSNPFAMGAPAGPAGQSKNPFL